MANAVIGALRVNLGIDTAAFQDGLKNAQTKMQQFGAMMHKVAIGAAAAAGAAVGALAIGVGKSVNEMDRMVKAAQQFGVPVDQLSRLKYAADLSGVSLESLGTSMQRLSRNMVDVANGATGPTADAFAVLGIAVKNADGTLRSSTEVMADISDHFARMPDGAQKTALAMQMLGKSGAGMIPMLNGGSAALKGLMQEADQFGVVIDEKAARAAERFNDNITRLTRAKDGLFMKIAHHLVPILDRLSVAMVEFVKDGDAVERMAGNIKVAVEFLARELGHLLIIIPQLRAEFAGLAEAWDRLTSGDFGGAWDAFMEGQRRSVEMAAQMRSDIDAIFNGTADALENAAAGAAGAGEIMGEAFATGLGSKASKIDEVARKMASDAASFFEATRTPAERYSATIQRLNELLQAGAIDQDTYNRAVYQAQDAFDTATKAAEQSSDILQSVGYTLESAFTSAFDRMMEGTFRLKDAIKSLLADLAKLLANSAFRALIGGGSGGGGLIGAILGSLPGFATGGSFRVGGAGGVDSQLVAFRATPGEQVDVRTPGQMAAGGGGADTVNVNVNVSGARGNMEIQEMVAAGVRQGLMTYDRALPMKVKGITGTGLRRGDIR